MTSTKAKPKTYTTAQVETIAAQLRAMPAPAPPPMSKAQAVQALAAEIAARQQQGHTIEAIARTLTDAGLQIKPGTLKNYLQRSKSKTDSASKPKREKQKPAPKAVSGETPKASEAALLEALTETPKGTFSIPPDRTTGV